MTAAPIRPITITPSPYGTPTIQWDMDVETADIVLTAIARYAATDPNVASITLLDPLYLAISQAMDTTTTNLEGCPGLWPDAPHVTLTEPAIIGDDTGDLLAVLIPGQVDTLDAITTAVNVALEAGANINPNDPHLYAEVQRPRWLVLNSCESSLHDFHPELAVLGPRTPGAILVTRVDLIHEPANA